MATFIVTRCDVCKTVYDADGKLLLLDTLGPSKTVQFTDLRVTALELDEDSINVEQVCTTCNAQLVRVLRREMNRLGDGSLLAP